MNYKTCFVTGAAGFIGSNLVDRLLQKRYYVVGYDNFSTGFDVYLENANKDANFSFIKGDILDLHLLTEAMAHCDVVWHLAANADVRHGIEHPRKDLDQNTVGTFNVLEAMRINRIKDIIFSSTGSIYGETKIIPTPEEAPFPVQTSLYSASKLAGEGLIEAYCKGFDLNCWIFRFVSVLGERYSHGHVYDFYKQLIEHPRKLIVLGNGKQKKSYLYINDCIDAMLIALEKSNEKINILNLGTDQYCEVNDSIQWIIEYLDLHPKLEYTGGDRGWIGDNPFIYLDTKKISNLGWKPKYTIKESVLKTLKWFENNPEVCNFRP